MAHMTDRESMMVAIPVGKDLGLSAGETEEPITDGVYAESGEPRVIFDLRAMDMKAIVLTGPPAVLITFLDAARTAVKRAVAEHDRQVRSNEASDRPIDQHDEKVHRSDGDGPS